MRITMQIIAKRWRNRVRKIIRKPNRCQLCRRILTVKDVPMADAIDRLKGLGYEDVGHGFSADWYVQDADYCRPCWHKKIAERDERD